MELHMARVSRRCEAALGRDRTATHTVGTASCDSCVNQRLMHQATNTVRKPQSHDKRMEISETAKKVWQNVFLCVGLSKPRTTSDYSR